MRWFALGLGLLFVGCDSPAEDCAPRGVYLVKATPMGGGVNPCARHYDIGGEVYYADMPVQQTECEVDRQAVACGESSTSRCGGYLYSLTLQWGADRIGRGTLVVDGECSSSWDVVYTPTRP